VTTTSAVPSPLGQGGDQGNQGQGGSPSP